MKDQKKEELQEEVLKEEVQSANDTKDPFEGSKKTTVEEYNKENEEKYQNRNQNRNIKEKESKKFTRKRNSKVRKILTLLICILIILAGIFGYVYIQNAQLDAVNDAMKIYKGVPMYELPIKEEIVTPTFTNEQASKENVGEMIGYVQVPAVGLKAPIYQAASGSNEDMQKVMHQTVAHDPNTALSGEGKNIVLTGHREEQFGRLQNVQKEDLIIVVIKENTYLYEIRDLKVVDEEGTDSFSYVYDEQGEEQLVLFTCFPFKRFSIPNRRYIVRADRIKEYNKEIEVREEA